MALLSRAVNPFKGTDIENAYVKMKDFAFILNSKGRIGFMAYRSESDRQADRMPYPLDQSATDVIVRDQTELKALTNPLFLYIAGIVAAIPEFDGSELNGAGFVKAYQDSYGELHESAYYTPVFCEANFSTKSALIRLGIFASKEAFEAGAKSFPADMRAALGGAISIQHQEGVEEVPQNKDLPDFETFISGLDEVSGRPSFYGYAKTQNPYLDNCSDC